jgi:predicted nucleic acid-binding Zn ribbon protein
MSDDPLVHCPDCGEASLQKELSAPKFRLKGSGWYETDFKTANKRNLHGESKDDSKSTTKPDAKPDSKPDTKSDSKPSASKAKSD